MPDPQQGVTFDSQPVQAPQTAPQQGGGGGVTFDSQPVGGQSQTSNTSNSDPSAPSLADKVNDVGDNLAKGFGKGVISTTTGIGHIIHNVGEYVHPGLGETLVPQSGLNAEESYTHPHGVAQDLGYGGESLTEFMLGDEALKGLSQADKLGSVAKWMKIAEGNPRLIRALQAGADITKLQGELTPEEMQMVKSSPLIAKIIGVLVPAARAGVVQGTQTLARSGGDLKQAVTSGLEGAATVGALHGATRVIGAAASKVGKVGRTAGELAETAASAPDKQTVAENIQGRLAQSESDLHTNYEDQTKDFQNRLDGAEIDPKTAPIATKAEDILQKPDPGDHSSVQQLKDIRGDKLDPKVREFLENTASGKQPITDEDIQTADETNANKPKLLGADGKPIESQDVEPEAQDQEPHDAHSLIQWRQQVRALASEYPPGDVNARALKRLLYDASDSNGAGGSAFDDTFSQLADKSGDPEVVDEYKALRDDYRNKISKYDDPIIKNLMEGKPDDAAKAFVGTKNASGLPTTGKTEFNTDTLRGLIGDDGVKHFGDEVFKSMMKDSSDHNGFNAAKFMDTWKRVSNGTKSGFFNVDDPDSIVKKIATDAKSVANLQKLTRAGLLSVGGKLAAAHPLGTGIATAIAFVAGHNGGGGIEKGRELLDYVANHPKMWSAYREAGKAADSTTANVVGKVISGAGKAVTTVDESNRVKQNTYRRAGNALSGDGKPLTELSDPGPGDDKPPPASSPDAVTLGNRSIEDLPPEIRNAITTIPVSVTQGKDIDDPNDRGGNRTTVANVDQGAGNNNIEINNSSAFSKNPTATMGHEVTHVWQNNLPPSVQAKIPDDPKDMSAFDISDVDKLRNQGKTLVDVPREKAATIVQKYIEAKPNSATRKKLQPWIDDMGKTPLSSTMPTSPDSKRLNMTPRPPGLPDKTVAGMSSAISASLAGKSKKK